MADYDRVGEAWVPYLMNFHIPNVKLRSVSTDEHGFRVTLDAEQRPISGSAFRAGAAGAHGIVLGSSAAFGVGASTDGHHVASVLNGETSTNWLAYGGRAFNSTQEVLLLLLFPPRKLDELVVFSGVNNLTLAYLTSETSSVFNSFFRASVFRRAMEQPPGDHIGIRRAFARLLAELRHKVAPLPVPPHRDISGQYRNILSCFRRDLEVLAGLGRTWGTQVRFFLQPLAGWIERDESPEERRIFSVLDEVRGDYQVLARYLGSQGRRYREDIANVCSELNVAFTDLNGSPAFATDEWLFVDRVHLTDLGYQRVAEAIRQEAIS